MFFVIIAILLSLFIFCYVVKKECFENNTTSNSSGQKYTISEISHSVNALIDSLNERHSLVKVHSVTKISPYITFDCMLYNHDKPSVKNFHAKVKIPLNSKNQFVLENANVSDSNEIIENGTKSIRESQFYGNIISS